jgi:hypothetical protein
MVILAIGGLIFGAIYDSNNWIISLQQNLPSELIGVAVSVLITVFFVDQIVKRRELSRWKPIRRIVYRAVYLNAEFALKQVCPNICSGDPNLSINKTVEYITTLVIKEDFNTLESIVLAKYVPDIIDSLDQHIENILKEIDFSRQALINNPEIIEISLKLRSDIKMLKNSLALFTRSTQPPDVGQSTIAIVYPTVTLPFITGIKRTD